MTDTGKPYWSVTVSIDDEEILTIGSDFLSGIPDIDKYDDVIRTCAQHLLAFVGPENPEPFLPDEDEND